MYLFIPDWLISFTNYVAIFGLILIVIGCFAIAASVCYTLSMSGYDNIVNYHFHRKQKELRKLKKKHTKIRPHADITQ